MKKSVNRKLVLHRETVQTLTLREVTGGAINLSQLTSCFPYRCVPSQTPGCASYNCTTE